MQQDSMRSMQRRDLIAARDALPKEVRDGFSKAITDHLRVGLSRAIGPIERIDVGAYYPIGAEPDIVSIYPEFMAVALPSVTSKDAALTFLRYQPGTRLVHEGFGVQVPERREVINPSILLIPCVGFKRRPDGRIDRLGYGGGFYDRTLASGTRVTIGIAFAQCEVAGFEPQAHDRALDAVVTERGIFGQLPAVSL